MSRRLATTVRAATSIVLATIMVAGGFVPAARAAADPSDVVLEFDFSASILRDAQTRNQFADALDGIASSVRQQSASLVEGDATVSMVQFASKAIDYAGCVDLKLLDSPDAVSVFANCLQKIAAAYRKGLDPALTAKIGVDTNYVAALQQAGKHLPADAVRPALILFTDGKHDVKGVPVSAVQPARDALVNPFKSFALLPVGMGIDPKERQQLVAGLEKLKIVKDMPACVSGTRFDWPTVGFNTPAQAGTAVATALQDATCTYTAAVIPTPAPTPPPNPGAVAAIGATPGDGSIKLTWRAITNPPVPVTDYLARCRAGDSGDWINSTEGTSTEPTTTITGLTNGSAYQCQVAAVGKTGPGPWVPAASAVTPIGKPATPAKPTLTALNQALQIGLGDADPAGVTTYHVECSPDNGNSWPTVADVPAASDAPSAQIGGLTNGTTYVCRAYAKNSIGQSDASPLSDAVKPCGGLLDCNGLLVPVIGILGVVLAIGLLAVGYALYREGKRGYVVAVVDVIHTANLGHGTRLGIGFIRTPGSKAITGIAVDKTKNADIKIRLLPGGRFSVRDGAKRHVTSSGEPLIVIVQGVRHELVLHAFATNAASRATRA
jgi:fibronectin type III domain protein